MPTLPINWLLKNHISGAVAASPVQLTIVYTATQFDFKWKAPNTSTLVFNWGDDTTSEVSGNDDTVVTTTSSYSGADTYEFSITGDVLDLTYIDVSAQAFISGDWGSVGAKITSLLFMDISGTGITGVTDVPVILQVGASNAVGQPGIAVLDDLPVAYQGEQSNIKIFWEGDYLTVDPANGAFVNMNPVLNTRHPDYTDPGNAFYNRIGWSAEQRYAHYLLDDYANVYIIKSGYGGKVITHWASPAGERWVELNRYVTNGIRWLLANSMNPVFLNTMWMQGESDISGATAQATYEAALTTFISNLRGLSEYLTDHDFYMSKIPTNYWGDETICNTSFANIAGGDAHAFVLETTQYSAGYDATDAGHYIGQNLLDLGADLYDAITYGIPLQTNLELQYTSRAIIENAGDASSLLDVSGNVRDGAQATGASQPLIVVESIGNHDALLFDGTDDWINSPDFAIAGGGYTLYVVCSVDSIASTGAMIGNSSGGNIAAFWINGGKLGVFLGAVNDVTAGAPTEGLAYVSCFKGGGASFAKIGSESDTDANGATGINGICVGRYANSDAQCMNGKFYELLVYSAAHDESTRNSILAYLDAKYGIL